MCKDVDYLIQVFGSKAELAKAAKVSRATVTHWSNGRCKPNSASLLNIQRASKGKVKAKKIRPELFTV